MIRIGTLAGETIETVIRNVAHVHGRGASQIVAADLDLWIGEDGRAANTVDDYVAETLGEPEPTVDELLAGLGIDLPEVEMLEAVAI